MSSTSSWLRQLLEWQKEVRDPNEFIHSLKVDLYRRRSTRSPKGEVKAVATQSHACRLRVRHPY